MLPTRTHEGLTMRTLTRTLLSSAVAVSLGLTAGCPSTTQQVKPTGEVTEQPEVVEKKEEKKKKEDDTELVVREVVIPETPSYVDGVDREAQDLFKEGVIAVYMTPPDFEEAQGKFQAAIDKDSKFLEAYFNLGMVSERLGKKEEALAIYQKALSANPNSIDAKAFVGKIYLANARDARQADNASEAAQWEQKGKSLLDEAVLKDADNVNANNGLALYWLSKNDVDRAEEFVKKVLSVDPRNVSALNTRGLINYLKKDYRIAKWIFEQKVLQIDPNSTEALTNLGLTYLAMGQKPPAVANFQRAVKLDPDIVPARMNLAAIFLDYLNYAAAQEQYGIVLEKQPENIEALIGFGTSQWGMQEYQQAAETYSKVLGLAPKQTMLLERLGKIYEGPLSDTKKAIEYYKQYIAVEKLPPTHVLAQKIQILENSNFPVQKDDDGGDGGDGGDMEPMDGGDAPKAPKADAPEVPKADEAPKAEAAPEAGGAEAPATGEPAAVAP